MTRFFFLYLVSYVLGCTCQNDILPPSTIPETFPFQAYIDVDDVKLTGCGAILISPEHVLAPASCVVGKSIVNLYLGFHGNPYFLDQRDDPNTQIYRCTKFIVHDDYMVVNNKHLNNIAIVKPPYAGAVKLNTRVQPGNLITKEEGQSLSGNIVNITGWIPKLYQPLMVAEVTLRTQDTCRFLFGQHIFMDQEICAKYSSTSKHLNLIGNAVSINGNIIGLLANTPACSSITCSQTAMILSVVPFLDWISRHTHVKNDVLSNKPETFGSFIKEIQAEKIKDGLMAQRLIAMITKTRVEEERILKLETTLETVKNQMEINTFTFAQKLKVVESKINPFKQDDESSIEGSTNY